MKKLVSLLLALMLLTSGVALADLNPAANTFPVSEERVAIEATQFGARTEIIDWNTNWLTEWWENRLNVDITWNAIPSETATEMFNLMFSSGEMPDIFFGGIGTGTAAVYGAQGYLLPLNDYIDEWGANLQYLYSIDDQLEGMLTSPDGNIYALPYYIGLGYNHTSAASKMMMNTTWLDNLGLEVPSTTDELYEVLKAFKEQDANGNGDPNDEIPISSPGKNNRVGTYIMQAFTYMGNHDVAPHYFYEEDGVVKVSYTQDGWREGLTYLNKLYAEGLYDPECFVADATSLKMLTGNENGTRLGASEHYAWSGIADLTLIDVCEQYEFIEPLKNADGERVTPGSKATVGVSCAIDAMTEYPEVCFRYADALLADPLSSDDAMTGLYGPEGEGWRKAEEGEVGADLVTPATYDLVFVWGQPNNFNYHETNLIRYNSDVHKLYDAAVIGTEATSFDQGVALMVGTTEKYTPYLQFKTLPSMIQFTEEEVAEASQLKTDVETYVQEMLAAFMTGTKSIESDWDAYLAQLETIGLSRLIELYQTAYDRQFGA